VRDQRISAENRSITWHDSATDHQDIDVLIVGAGIAGLCSAYAMHQLGYCVTIIEPTLKAEKRLAGEVIHPTGVDAFVQLGLSFALDRLHPLPIRGFAVWEEYDIRNARHRSRGQTMPYSDVKALKGDGLSLEHTVLRDSLLTVVSNLPNVRVLVGHYLSGLDTGDPSCVIARVNNRNRETVFFRCRLLVGADGASSPTRHMAGIRAKCERLSYMLGYTVTGAQLPYPNYAHSIAGGGRPIIAYQCGPQSARILFDAPLGYSIQELAAHCNSLLACFPPALRSSVKKALDEQNPRVAVNRFVTVASNGPSRIVLVGDAGGCCYPFSASGLTNCARDALRLQEAVKKTHGDFARATTTYRQLRIRSERIRSVIAQNMYEVSCSEMSFIQAGSILYWEQSRRGRAHFMALLSGCEERTSVVVQEWTKILMWGVIAWFRQSHRKSGRSFSAQRRFALKLARLLLRNGGVVLNIGLPN
jgi:2-polyprenyl-6-methoxyphenol hydroxylase-like FAD-dependent oxidoreductase